MQAAARPGRLPARRPDRRRASTRGSAHDGRGRLHTVGARTQPPRSRSHHLSAFESRAGWPLPPRGQPAGRAASRQKRRQPILVAGRAILGNEPEDGGGKAERREDAQHHHEGPHHRIDAVLVATHEPGKQHLHHIGEGGAENARGEDDERHAPRARLVGLARQNAAQPPPDGRKARTQRRRQHAKRQPFEHGFDARARPRGSPPRHVARPARACPER